MFGGPVIKEDAKSVVVSASPCVLVQNGEKKLRKAKVSIAIVVLPVVDFRHIDHQAVKLEVIGVDHLPNALVDMRIHRSAFAGEFSPF